MQWATPEVLTHPNEPQHILNKYHLLGSALKRDSEEARDLVLNAKEFAVNPYSYV